MADNDQPSRLEAATVKAEAGSQIVSDFANLPADQTVATASGNIPTLAGVIGTIQDEGDQAAADVRAKADAQVQAAIGTLVKKAGDSMSGLLILSGDPTSSLGAAPKRYVDNALSESKSYTDGKVSNISVAFSKYYESSLITLSGSQTDTSLDHSLGGVPRYVGAYLICTSSDAEYSQGDIIEIPPYMIYNGSAPNGIQAIISSSRILIKASNQGIISVPGKNSQTKYSIRYDSWKLVVRAAL